MNKENVAMTRKTFLWICCVLLASPVLAQSRGAKQDALSGAWTGEMVVDRERSITFELKFDGKGNVTGTFTGMPNPGDVKKGTFDPKTGALKLDVGIKGDAAVRLVFEGTVVKDKAAGKVSGEASGEFKIAKKPTR
jgi:hypothetical protein